MRKKTRALSGASQDAYFRRVLKAHPTLSAEERDELLRRLRQEVAQLHLRTAALGNKQLPPAPDGYRAKRRPSSSDTNVIAAAEAVGPTIAAAAPPFDPFSPNIVVIVRTAGREAALGALGGIDDLDNLRLLAREQRLHIGPDLSSATELRAAIVAAAERRIANRLAAAS